MQISNGAFFLEGNITGWNLTPDYVKVILDGMPVMIPQYLILEAHSLMEYEYLRGKKLGDPEWETHSMSLMQKHIAERMSK